MLAGLPVAQLRQLGFQFAATGPVPRTQGVELAGYGELALAQLVQVLMPHGDLLLGFAQPLGGGLGGLNPADLLGEVLALGEQFLFGGAAAFAGEALLVLLGGADLGGRGGDLLSQVAQTRGQFGVGEQADSVAGARQGQPGAGAPLSASRSASRAAALDASPASGERRPAGDCVCGSDSRAPVSRSASRVLWSRRGSSRSASWLSLARVPPEYGGNGPRA
ncbi:hypothetical protein [Nonomuraea sp. NPDC050691]|uniref:hypothetical protein n=1 Tax=Nonomuraea sp. NPDC050691 TaxID=3155661 RepID=UPI0033D608EC